MSNNQTAPLLSSVEGNSQCLDGGAMFGNMPRIMWGQWYPTDEQGRIELGSRAMLIEVDGKKVLCDTGIGASFSPKLADRYGVKDRRHKLLLSLADLGVSDQDIDYIILSDLHFDHVGGLFATYAEIEAGQHRLLFPNACYIVSLDALQRAKKPHPRDKASFIPGLYEKLERSHRLIIVESDKIPGLLEGRLSFHYTEGHTPGLLHTVFHGDEYTIFFASDLIPGIAWIHLPITMGYDRYPEKVIDEKSEVYQAAIVHKWRIFYTHDPQYALSEIEYDATGRYQARHPLEKLVRVPF